LRQVAAEMGESARGDHVAVVRGEECRVVQYQLADMISAT
jgi:hypothetical protein